MNTVHLIGRIVKELELQYTQNQKAILKFTVAVNRKDKEADFISCVAFDKTAENIATLSKGKGGRIAIEGSIKTGSYKNKDGATVYTTDVMVGRADIIDFKEKGELTPPPLEQMLEDVPF